MKFRSKFEARFNQATGGKLEYEKDKIKYVIPASNHVYTPDFHIKGTNIYLETKGIWSALDRKKMLLIKQQHPEVRVIMVFQNANNPITKSSKTTYSDWAEKNGIEWLSIQDAVKLIKQHSPKCL